MKRTIWKFGFPVRDEALISMPRGAEITHVGNQGHPDEVNVWAIVDPQAPRVSHRFSVRGTGHELTGEEGEHLASFQSGPLVWHVFDGGEEAS